MGVLLEEWGYLKMGVLLEEWGYLKMGVLLEEGDSLGNGFALVLPCSLMECRFLLVAIHFLFAAK
tara:strand:+ start:825 stop:1019 length:195 start_codon:yes stop_codon:yes gene_type:complete